MSKYASLLFSPEKYHEISPFRFPIYEDLVPGEAKGIEKLTRDQSKNTFKSIKVAQRIAKAKGISTKEAVELLSKIGSEEDNQDFLYEYASELEDLQSDSLGNVETKVAYVTLFMQYRAEAQINGKRKWERLEIGVSRTPRPCLPRSWMTSSSSCYGSVMVGRKRETTKPSPRADS